MKKRIKIFIITARQLWSMFPGIDRTWAYQIITFDESVTSHKIIEQVHHHQPDILFVSLQTSGIKAIELIRRIANQYPHIGIMAIAKPDDLVHVFNALKAGARGCLTQNFTKQEISIAVKAVYFGGTYFGSGHFKKLVKLAGNKGYQLLVAQDYETFSEIELHVLKCICQEKETAQIALELNVKVSTIEACRSRLYEKTGAKHIAGLAIYALRYGYFCPCE